MENRETTFYTDPKGVSPVKGSPQIRIDGDLYARIREISAQCMLSDREVLSRIVRDALPFVRLRERKVYEIETGTE